MLGTASEIVGDSAAATAAWTAAAAAAGPGGERALRLRRAALTGWNLGRFADAWQYLSDANADLADLPPGRAHVAVQETRTALAARVEDARLAAELERLDELADLTGSEEARLVVLYARIALLIRRGELEAAVPLVARVYAMADATGDDAVRERVRRPGGQVAFNRGDLATAEQDGRVGLGFAVRTGVPTLGGPYVLYLANIAQLRGDTGAEASWLGRLGDLAQLGRFDRGVVLHEAVRGVGTRRPASGSAR